MASIFGSNNALPIYALNSDTAILASGSVGLPSLRFANASASGLYLSGANTTIASSGFQCALFTPTTQTLTGQVDVPILNTSNVICTSISVGGSELLSPLVGASEYTPVLRDASGGAFGGSISTYGRFSRYGNLVLFDFGLTTSTKAGVANSTARLSIPFPSDLENGTVNFHNTTGVTLPTGATSLAGSIKDGNIILRFAGLNQIVSTSNIAGISTLAGGGMYYV